MEATMEATTEASDKLICFSCERAELQTTIEEQDIPYGTAGLTFHAKFPVHYCPECGDGFLTEDGMAARDAAQREFEATLKR